MKSFIRRLEDHKELRRIRVEVDPVLEISAITNRVCKQPGEGMALLFEHVKDSEFAVATNLFGSQRRACLAWGRETPEDLAIRLAENLEKTKGQDSEVRLRNLLCKKGANNKTLRDFSLQETSADLLRLPALQSWPGDGGRYLTLALVSMFDSFGKGINWGIYRIQILDAQRAAIHFLPHSQGARVVQEGAKNRQPMPVAIALGGDPGMLAAAALPLPAHVDEAAFLSLIRGQEPELAAAPLSGLPVPADAEIVLEGEIHPGENAMEGPFGNHTGYYQPARPAPVLRIKGFYQAAQAFCPATVVGPPPMENIHLVRSAEPLVLALLRNDYPHISSLRYFTEGIFHGCCQLALEPGSALRPLDLARLLWRSGPLRRARLLVFVDAEEEQSVPSQVFWRAINQVTPGRDLLESEGRMAIDATRKSSLQPIAPDPSILAKISQRWRDYGLE